MSADGVLTNYHKTHQWWKDQGVRHEPTLCQPGDRLVTFNVKGHKCGLMICYDGDFPEMTRAYANLGCSVLFWLNNRGRRGHAEVKDLVHRFTKWFTHQATIKSNFFQRWTTGVALISAIPSRILSLSSALDLTRICFKNVWAIFPKSVSTRFSHEPCLGV